MQPDTLSAQVLRAKNYPDGRLLKGRVEEGFFLYVAESIVVVLLTFRRGHIWTVGNGKGVDIWNDHWVPILTHLPEKLMLSGQVLLRTVDELIDP